MERWKVLGQGWSKKQKRRDLSAQLSLLSLFTTSHPFISALCPFPFLCFAPAHLVALPTAAKAQETPVGNGPESSEARESPRGLQRWHPEAFVDPLTGTDVRVGSPDFEVEYVPVERPERNRKRAIALGVTIPILAAGVGMAIGAAVVMSRWEMSWNTY